MSLIAIITARGGSKRIPKKNVKEFFGQPILAYSVRAAIESGIFDEVMVSTDSEEIAEIARKYGAAVPFMRSEATSNDFATTADVLTEVLDEYEKIGKKFDDLCCIYPTAPFVTDEKLRNAYKLFKDTKADNLMTVIKFSFPPQRGLVYDSGETFVEYREPQYANTRSQDLQPMFHDCGQFYFSQVEKFRVNKHLVKGNTVPFFLPETEVQDIDNVDDWAIAEIKFKAMMAKKGK